MLLLGALLASSPSFADEPASPAEDPPPDGAPTPTSAPPAAEGTAAEATPAEGTAAPTDDPQRPTEAELRARYPDAYAFARAAKGRGILTTTVGGVGFFAGYLGFQLDTVDSETAPIAFGTSLLMGAGLASVTHGSVSLAEAHRVRRAMFDGDDPAVARRHAAAARAVAHTDLYVGIGVGVLGLPFLGWGAALAPQSEHDAVAAASTGVGLVVAGGGFALLGGLSLAHARAPAAAPALLLVPRPDGAVPVAGLEGRW